MWNCSFENVLQLEIQEWDKIRNIQFTLSVEKQKIKFMLLYSNYFCIVQKRLEKTQFYSPTTTDFNAASVFCEHHIPRVREPFVSGITSYICSLKTSLNWFSVTFTTRRNQWTQPSNNSKRNKQIHSLSGSIFQVFTSVCHPLKERCVASKQNKELFSGK